MAFAQDLLTRVVNVRFGGYANRAIIVTDAHPANVHATKNGWQWDDIGDLGYVGTGWDDPFTDTSVIVFGGYRRDNIDKFVVSGAKQNWNGITTDPAVPFDSVSNDGYAWSAFGENMDPDLNWSYAKGTRIVNGYVYRVGGSGVANNSTTWGHVDDDRYDEPKFARYAGSEIQRCSDTSAKEDDDSSTWLPVLSADSRYLEFGPIQVIKGDGPDDVPTLLCLVVLDDPDRKFGVLSSSDGTSFTLTYQGQVIHFGGADPVGFAAAKAS